MAAGDLGAIGWSFVLTLAAGSGLYFGFPGKGRDISGREAFLLVVLVWLAICFFGCLPFYFSPPFESFTDAFFESVSGFTTTGATILDNVEAVPPAVQLWRCFSHWIGGMGIVLLGVAILPLLSAGGMQLYRAEFSGAKSEKLKPRIAETAIALWHIYCAFTLAQYVALRLAGMGPFDAVCHAFSTLATGGFSTRTASLGDFASPVIHYITIFSMLMGGINFTRHYRLLVERKPATFFGDVEVRAYFAVVGVCTAVVLASLLWHHDQPLESAFRHALFQVVSILTTTGFVTMDYETWPYLPQTILLALMLVGGCTGSTSGGLKIARLVLLFKVVSREFRRMVERHGVFKVRMGDQVIPEATIQNLLNLLYLGLLINLGSVFILSAFGVDVFTSISAVTACMFNIGPSLGEVGPTDHYGHLPGFVKWVLSGCMIAGRLEFYTLLVILTPFFWRK
jgi:trk system potassium uptake protein